MAPTLARLVELTLKDEKSAPAFRRKTIRTRSGESTKLREIAAPNQAARAVNYAIMERLEEEVALRYYGRFDFGVRNETSAIENAGRHLGSRFFYKLDLKNAYPSTSLVRLAALLHDADPTLGSEGEIVQVLGRYCAVDGTLATGAPASPMLFNLYCIEHIDRKIKSFLRDGQRYTRYLDDLVLSSEIPISFRLRDKVRQVVRRAGFAVNHNQGKSDVIDRWRQDIRITGVVLTRHGELRPPDASLAKVEEALSWQGTLTLARRQQIAGLAGYLLSFGEGVPPDVRELQLKLRAHLESVRSNPRRYRLPKKLSAEFIEQIIYAVPISRVVGRLVPFKRVRGEVSWARCPFHREKTPSFKADNRRRMYKCFGCGAGGNAIKFVMETEGWTFREGIRVLVERYDISLRPSA